MEVIWKNLDDTVHQIELGYLILAVDNLNHKAEQGLVSALYLGERLCKLKRHGTSYTAKTVG